MTMYSRRLLSLAAEIPGRHREVTHGIGIEQLVMGSRFALRRVTSLSVPARAALLPLVRRVHGGAYPGHHRPVPKVGEVFDIGDRTGAAGERHRAGRDVPVDVHDGGAMDERTAIASTGNRGRVRRNGDGHAARGRDRLRLFGHEWRAVATDPEALERGQRGSQVAIRQRRIAYQRLLPILLEEHEEVARVEVVGFELGHPFDEVGELVNVVAFQGPRQSEHRTASQAGGEPQLVEMTDAVEY